VSIYGRETPRFGAKTAIKRQNFQIFGQKWTFRVKTTTYLRKTAWKSQIILRFGSKLAKMGQNIPRFGSKLAGKGPKQPQIWVETDRKSQIIRRFGSKWAKMGQNMLRFGSKLSIKGPNHPQIWVVNAQISPFFAQNCHQMTSGGFFPTEKTLKIDFLTDFCQENRRRPTPLPPKKPQNFNFSPQITSKRPFSLQKMPQIPHFAPPTTVSPPERAVYPAPATPWPKFWGKKARN